MDVTTVKTLLDKFRNGTLDAEDRRQFGILLEDSEARASLESLIDGHIGQPWPQYVDGETKDLIYLQLLQAIEKSEVSKSQQKRAPIVRMWKKVAVAVAAVLLLVGGLLWLMEMNNSSEHAKALHLADVSAPDKSRATITLTDGKIINLDGFGSGQISMQGNILSVRQPDGKLLYQSEKDNNPLAYNTLRNPEGSKIVDLVLSDGSHVWLNAGSSITFPAAFSDGERYVSVTGDAYFEVTHDSRRPFVVNSTRMNVKVLGTHFDINTYGDGGVATTTLLEGRVEVSNGVIKNILNPGERALMDTVSNTNLVVEKCDPESAVAWTKGKFSFDNMDVETIMNQLKRWYSVQVVYEKDYNKKTQYYGRTPMSQNLSEVLKVLELAGLLCELNNKTIYVKQMKK